jgi:hypothetical protein
MNIGRVPPQNEEARTPTEWESAAASRIANLRKRLLDLTNANRLLNFRFRERSRSYVRVIEAIPDVTFAKLAEGEQFQFKSLPEKTDESPDEKTDRFLMALEQARLSDTGYQNELDALDDDPEGEQTLQVERRLKDRVREQLGLPPLSEIKELSLAAYAKLHGIDPKFDLPAKSNRMESESSARNDLQLLLLPEQMERSLSGISDQARTALQEKGVNILCVAFGFLEWYESDSSEKAMFAPLQGLVLEKLAWAISALSCIRLSRERKNC